MLYIIGMGASGLESLASGSLETIKRASLVMGAPRHLKAIEGISQRTLPLGPDMDKAFKRIGRELEGRKEVVLLATGDPLFFGIGELAVKRIGRARVTVLPNVSVVQEAFSRLKQGWAGAKVISLHGRKDAKGLLRGVIGQDRAAIFTDPENTPSLIARTLLDQGIKDYTAYVLEAIGTCEEKIIKGTLQGMARKRRFNPLNIMVLIRKQTRRTFAPAPFGMPDDLFIHSSGTMTKQEVRAVVVSKLGISAGSVVWDVGAGFGTVSIEAARLVPSATVYAVEKKRDRAVIIGKNMARFKAQNLHVVQGIAPEALKGLPRPDRVFIGGGGEDVSRILGHAARRLKGRGRVVVSAVTIETLVHAASFFMRKGWDWEAVCVNISKTKRLGRLSMLAASNPVFIVTGERKGPS